MNLIVTQCMHFINEINKLICAFLLIFSSSIGVGDVIASPSTLNTIGTEIGSAKTDVTTHQEGAAGQAGAASVKDAVDTFDNKAMTTKL